MRSEFQPLTTSRTVSWRTLGALAVPVLLVHALVLQTQPARLEPAQATALLRVAALATRRIPPAPLAAAVSVPPADIDPTPVAPKPAKQPARPAAKALAKPAATPAAPAPPALPAPAALPAADISTAQALERLGSADSRADDTAGPDDATPSPTIAEAVPTTNDNDINADAATAATPPDLAPAAPSPPPDAGTPALALVLPASAQLSYQMTGSAKGLIYHAKGEMDWHNDGASYQARMTVRALFLGSRTMHSTGELGDQGLAPRRFSDQSKKSERAAHFEPDKGQISFSANTPPAPWTAGAQDRLSIFLQLGGLLAGNPAGFPVGTRLSLLTAGPRDAADWTFVVQSEERLQLPFGELATLKLSRQPVQAHDQTIEIWYAPALGYLPVRQRITQASGDFIDQQLSALTRP